MNKLTRLLVAIFLVVFSTTAAQEHEPAPPEPHEQQMEEPVPPPPKARSRNPLDELQELEAKEPPSRFLSDMLNMLTTLGLMVVVLVGISWFLKKMLNTRIQQANSNSLIKIHERRALSPKTAIYLLDICGKGIVVAESQNGVVHLADVSISEEEEQPQESDFQKILEQKNQRNP